MATTNGQRDEQREKIFEAVESKFGFVPNLIRELAESPAVAQTYLNGADALSSGAFTQKEQQVIQATVAVYNACHYCTAAHGTIALGAGLDKDELAAILKGETPSDERLAAIVDTTREVLEQRGWLDEDEQAAIEARGLSRAELFEIIGFIGVKTLSNYVNHVAETEVDEQFSEVTKMPEYQEAIKRKKPAGVAG
ncbi:MAG: carboxymuconolactone decarboxylase family protein [Rhodothermales bacterium]